MSLTQSARENWRTPAASDPEGGIEDWSTERFQNIDTPQIKLRDQAANWTTPLADDTNTRTNKFAQGGTPLSMQASNWPTPKVNDMDQDPEKARERMRKREEQNLTTGGIRNLTSEAKNWPTPTATERAGTNPKTGKGEGLNKTAKHWNNKETTWPTPNVSDKEAPNLKDNHDLEKGYLRGVSATWPTPMQRDYKGFDGPGKKNALKPPELYHSIHQGQETEKDGHSCSPSCRRLNPLFAEHLMGLPLGWTCVSEPLAMESFQQWQLALSENLQTS